MKSFVMLEVGKTGWIEKEKPTITPYDVLLKPLVVAMCSSDIHSVEMGAVAPNMSLGHEALGEVVEVGAEVKNFKVGDRVLVPSTSPNWYSLEAQKGVSQHSDHMFGGVPWTNKIDGCFGEFFIGYQADMNLHKIPEGMDYKTALMIVDMVTTGFQGVDNAGVKFGDTVVVLGIGPVGLMSVAGARLAGAGRIIAVGTRPNCVALAKEYGANDVVSYKDGDVVETILGKVPGGADVVIIAGGGKDVLGQALSLTRTGGTVSNMNYFDCPEIIIPAMPWGLGMAQKKIVGGLCEGGRVRMEALCNVVKYTGFNPGKMVTHEFQGFDKIPEAFELMAKKPADLIKPIVVIEKF